MRRILDLPLLVVLMGIATLSMLVPSIHALALGDERTARVFLYGAILFSSIVGLLAIATYTIRPRRLARSQLISLVGAYVVLPPMMAVPFYEALPGTSFLNAWFEMVSCLTTTGATVYDDPGRLAMSLHLWRGLVGWMGGFLVWVVAAAILAPMNLGGFEVKSSDSAGLGADTSPGFRPRESGERLVATTRHLLPVYAGLTVILWVALILAGSGPTIALIHAMATLSTSGISATGGLENGGAGVVGELAVAVFLIFALSRVAFSDLGQRGLTRRLRTDHELKLGLLIVGVVTLFLFLRHWVGAAESEASAATDIALGIGALWGALFTVLSFLTTTGFVSVDWAEAQAWSGLSTPGILLMGLAVLGGGVATTAGGVKLLRVWALYTHSAREMERLVYPSSIGGAGQAARRLRRQGAEIAWVFFMLFALSIAIVSAALALAGLKFETSMVLTVAALSTTGPLVELAAEAPINLPILGDTAKSIFMAAMVVGRLETLALIALFNPDFWRG